MPVYEGDPAGGRPPVRNVETAELQSWDTFDLADMLLRVQGWGQPASEYLQRYTSWTDLATNLECELRRSEPLKDRGDLHAGYSLKVFSDYLHKDYIQYGFDRRYRLTGKWDSSDKPIQSADVEQADTEARAYLIRQLQLCPIPVLCRSSVLAEQFKALWEMNMIDSADRRQWRKAIRQEKRARRAAKRLRDDGEAPFEAE